MIVDRKGMKIMRKLYHGSEKIIEESIYGKGENIMIMVWGSIAQIVLTWQKSGRKEGIQTDMQTAMNWIVTVLIS